MVLATVHTVRLFKENRSWVLILVLLLTGDHFLHFSERPSWKIYDAFSSLYQRITPPPSAIQDIVLVGIDSDTVARMKEKWPYSRATFATVLNHLKQSKARAVGLDFSFFGDSTLADDAKLRHAITEGNKVILASNLNEEGTVQFSTLSGLPTTSSSGIVSKFQDRDGLVRRAFTYLVSAKLQTAGREEGGLSAPLSEKRLRFFSWGMKLLEASGSIDLTSLDDRGDTLAFRNSEKKWKIPVDPLTKTFAIRFRAHSKDFERFSFYDILTNRFDPKKIESKIVLIGFLSVLFQDIHPTPIGWLPGVTLLANAFLTLYARDFQKPVPPALEIMVIAIGMFVSHLLLSKRSMRRPAPWLAFITLAFFAVSYLLFASGYTWNYALFPFGILFILGWHWLIKKGLTPFGRLTEKGRKPI